MKEHKTEFDLLNKSYIDLFPLNDMTSLVFWDRSVMNEIDSEILR